jgi:hypothetical protein
MQWDLPDHPIDALAPSMPEKAGVKAKKKKKKKFRSSKKPTDQEGVMRDPCAGQDREPPPHDVQRD